MRNRINAAVSVSREPEGSSRCEADADTRGSEVQQLAAAAVEVLPEIV